MAGKEEATETKKEEETKPIKPPTKKVVLIGQQPSAAEENASPHPDMSLCQKMHRLVAHAPLPLVMKAVDPLLDEKATPAATSTTEGSKFESLAELSKAVFTQIGEDLENPSLYRHLMETLQQQQKQESSMETDDDKNVLAGATAILETESVFTALETKNEAKYKELQAAVEEAREQAGDMEVLQATLEVARFAARSLDKATALQAYQQVIDLPKISPGKKIDARMEAARVASFYQDSFETDKWLDAAHKLATDDASGGGDWDRRNRLKVYRALQCLLHRKTKEASTLLTDCIATFSCNEMCTYAQFAVYCVLTNLLHLSRPQVKKTLLDGPEIRSVATEIPIVMKLAQSLYDCDYRSYLHAMVETEAILLSDRYLHRHAAFWMRELHLLAYKQFLDAYQSVTLSAMASALGVSVEFCDAHASRFIAAGRLPAKIDKYGGVIVTNRPDTKNAQYRDMIQKGDGLLNRIQALARVVDL